MAAQESVFGKSLAGKVAVVTGAGRGLGRACASALARAGAHIVLISRTLSDLEAIRSEITGEGGSAEAACCDVTDIERTRSVIDSLGRLDVLVNNAGTNRPQPFLDTPIADFDTLMALNVRAAYFIAQAAARRMVPAGEGSIIHISSQMGHVGAPNRTVYCMTKHAIEGLTKAMAVELGATNVRVNAVAPTFAETPLTNPFLEDPDFKRDVIGRIPLGRMASAEDVANAVCFLASPAARSITGHSLLVDGGWTAQ